jgi:hypothetical protein
MIRPQMSRPSSSTTALAGRLSLVVALAAVILVAVILTTVRGPTPRGSPPPLSSGERSAEGLVDSIGVVVHFNYVDTAYGRQAEVLSRLRELGIRHIRDAVPSLGEPLAAGLHAAGAKGISATLNSGDLHRDPARAVADSLTTMGNRIDAFEGPNELDNSGDPAWTAQLSAYMPALARAVRRQAPRVPVIGPSLVDPARLNRLPRGLPGLFNEHPYPQGGPPEPALGTALRALPARDPHAGVVFTETGYHNALRSTVGQPPVSEEAAAVYLPRLLLTAFGAGVQRTLVYELLDEKPDSGLANPEQHFGLLRNDLSPKPAFSAIRTLIAAFRTSPGPGRRDPFRWDLRLARSGDVRRLTFARRDGSRVIALWRPVSVWNESSRRAVEPPILPVELLLGRDAHDVMVWRPSASALPVLYRRTTRRLALALHGDVVLVSLR